MIRLICIKNPAIIISAPDELVSEVGGNCWQIGGPQPLTYPKHLWKKESLPSLPPNLDEAAEKAALKAYPEKDALNKKATGHYDPNYPRRKAYQEGYAQAEKDMIERAMNILNKQIDDLIYSRLTIGDFLKQFRKRLEDE